MTIRAGSPPSPSGACSTVDRRFVRVAAEWWWQTAAGDPVARDGIAATTGLPECPDPYVSSPDAGDDRERWLLVRPGWTEAGWWDADLDPQIRALLWLSKGFTLAAALQDLPVWTGRCRHPHDPSGWDDMGVTGHPCACLIVVTAAWATVAAWAADRADSQVLVALGATEHEVPNDPDRPASGSIVDPGVEGVAPALRRTPLSLRNLLARLRRRAQAPRSVHDAIADGALPSWQADLLLQDVADLDREAADLVLDTTMERRRHRHEIGLVGWTFADLRRSANRVRARLPKQVERERGQASRGRGVFLRDRGRSQASLIADFPRMSPRRCTAS